MYLVFFYVVSLVGVFLLAKRRYKVRFDVTEVNHMLTSILEENFKNSSLSRASQNLVGILRSFYKIDYVTILILKSRTVHIVSSNVQSKYLSELEKHCNTLVGKTGQFAAKVTNSIGGTISSPTAKERGLQFSAFIPLTIGNKTVGAVLLEHRNFSDLEGDKLRFELYNKVFAGTALVLQGVLYTEGLISMVSTDQLTGVYNRRFIDVSLAESISLHTNLAKVFTIVLLDIDFFKKVNDTYGHPFGDVVLRQMAGYLKSNLRDTDWVARYGGEEFMLFFGRSTVQEVSAVIKRLHTGIQNLNIVDGDVSVKITASFGVSSFPKDGGTITEIIASADKALYQSKSAGRNRITLAS